MTRPAITCVVPTYESPALAAQCLISIAAQRDIDGEIIVVDDSVSSRVAETVEALRPILPPVRFVAGARTGNPVDNWNHGLGLAAASVHLVIHQDEYLIDPLYLRRAVDALDRAGPDAVAARAGTVVIGLTRPSRFALASALVSRLPGARALLPAINWIGPTAAFVFRAGPRFDPSLVQLADVEFYGRVLGQGGLLRLPGKAVGSLGHHGEQITARIDPITLARQEMAMLAARAPAGITPLTHAIALTALRFRGRGG